MLTDELRCVLLVGDPGVGKSRLAAEFLADVYRRGVVLSARAYPLGASASFGLWAEALEGFLRGLTAEDVAVLCGGLLDDLANLVRSVAAVRGGVLEREPPRIRLFEAIAVVLSNLARDKPVVVVLDDVHLADSSSWEALQYLAHNLADARLLVVAAARPTELADHPIAPQVLFDLEQQGLLVRLPLSPLDVETVGKLAAGVLGGPAPPALVDWLEERAQGNALFAVGLLQALIDEGADLAAPRLQRLPEGLADRVNSRLKLLDEPSRATLEVLAVLGRRIGIAELAEVTSRPQDRLDELLDGLLRARLVLEQEQGHELTYEIAHPLIQEAIYQSIRGGRRRALHRMAGRSLLTAGLPGEAAPHFARSADPGDNEAISALGEALRQAEQRQADREALEILGALVELLPSGDERWAEVAQTMSSHAEWVVDHRADNTTLGVRAMREMSAVLAGSADLVARATIRLRLASFLAWGTPDTGEAERACRDALTLAEQAGDRPRTLLALNELAWIQGIRGDSHAMAAESGRVVEAAQALGERFALMQAWTTAGNAASFLGRFNEAEAALRESLAMATADGKLYEQTRVLSVLAFSLAYEGRIDEALEVVNQAKSANPSVPPTWEPFALWIKGDYPGALAAIKEAIAWKPIGASRRRGVLLAVAALAAAEGGEVLQARKYATAATAIYDGPFMLFSHYADYAAAIVTWREGKPMESQAALMDVAQSMLSQEMLPFVSPVLVDLAEVAAESQQTDVADKAATQLRVVAGALDRQLHHGLAALAGALAASGRGALEQAAAQARSALKAFADLGYPGYRGRALFVLGGSISPSDRAASIDALEQASSTFGRCGALWRRDRALDSLRALRGRGRRAAGALVGSASLTRREREVAALATQGLTAREIAARLYIGERTVEGHLATIYAKIGVRSKTDLMRRASEFSF